MLGTLLKQNTISNKHKVKKPQMHINRTHAMHVNQFTRTRCVQSSHFLPWCNCEEEFAPAWLLCQLLGGQLCQYVTL